MVAPGILDHLCHQGPPDPLPLEGKIHRDRADSRHRIHQTEEVGTDDLAVDQRSNAVEVLALDEHAESVSRHSNARPIQRELPPFLHLLEGFETDSAQFAYLLHLCRYHLDIHRFLSVAGCLALSQATSFSTLLNLLPTLPGAMIDGSPPQ
ncbi:MAG: hypothetical protein ACJ8BW_29020, partial [Ktedonobacteraceae bacterium]